MMQLANKNGGAKQGFTLVEIMIVIAVIGLLLAIAISNFVNARQTSQATSTYANMRVAGAAFAQYRMDHRDYPASTAPGVMPDGMEDYLGRFRWSKETPIGGQWVWDLNSHGFVAAVSVVGHNASDAVMQKLDDRADDGDLSSGNFRVRTGGHAYVIE